MGSAPPWGSGWLRTIVRPGFYSSGLHPMWSLRHGTPLVRRTGPALTSESHGRKSLQGRFKSRRRRLDPHDPDDNARPVKTPPPGGLWPALTGLRLVAKSDTDLCP